MSRIWLLGLTVFLAGVYGCGGKEESPAPAPTPPPAAPETPAAPASAPAPTPVPAEPAPAPAPSAGAAAGPDKAMNRPAEATAKAEAEKKEEAPAAPPREADPQLVEKVRQAAAAAGPADVIQSMKKIGKAFADYAETHDGRFPAIDGAVTATAAAPGQARQPASAASTKEAKPKGGLSWRVAILPQLGLDELYREFHLDEPWDSEHNKTLLSRMPALYGTSSRGMTRLHLITGKGTPFQTGTGPALAEFTDGLSNTLTVVQAGEDKEQEWTRSTALAFDATRPGESLGDVEESFLALTADGTLHRIPTETELLSNLIRHQDKQVIPTQFLKDSLNLHSADIQQFSSADLPPVDSEKKPFNSEFIPADATMMIVISPRRILESKLAQAFLKQFALEGETPMQTLDRMASQAGDDAGFPLAAAEEIRVFPEANLNPTAMAAMPSAAGGGKEEVLPPGIAAVSLRTSVSLPLDSVIRKMAEKAEKVDVEVLDGIPHVWLQGLHYTLAFPSDREMIVATRETIRKMTGPRQPAGGSKNLVESLDAMKGPMVAIAASAPDGGKLSFMQQAMSLAGPLALMAPQLADVGTIRLSLDVEGPELLKLSLGFPQEETSKTFLVVARNLLDAGIAQGKMLQSTLKQDDPAQKAQAALLADVLGGSSVQNDGPFVSLVIKQPQRLEDLVPAFQSQLQAAQMKSIPEDSLPPLERIARALVAYQEKHGHLPASNGIGEIEVNPRSAKQEKNTTPVPESGFNPPPAGTNLSGAGMQKSAAEEKEEAAIAKNRGLSWRVYLLPFLGEQGLYEQFHLNERWDSPHNKTLVTQMPAVFGNDPEGKTRIQLVVGNETLFKSGKSPDIESLRDDPAQTIVAIETGAEKAIIWTKPGGLPFDPKSPLKCLGNADEGQTEYQTIMLNWTIQRIPASISAEEFRALVQPSDGKPSRKSP